MYIPEVLMEGVTCQYLTPACVEKLFVTVSSVICVCFCCVASRPSVTGQGGAGAGMQLPGRHSEGEPAEGHGAGVHQLLFRPQEPDPVRKGGGCSTWEIA